MEKLKKHTLKNIIPTPSEVKDHIEKRLAEEKDYLAVSLRNNNKILISFWTWAVAGTERLLVLANENLK